ncbi:hypothetical protein L1987_28339 [Smallanthus sonchifolius]|uniref:Uncharacterized protein n=1 Tax=Smallanthus sonchifolius TaxID=185202 RepID=A0ACB9HXF5_9ASTR|nr:hypothetical protein L1987_28339 [Smallanthus sonchifolius]
MFMQKVNFMQNFVPSRPTITQFGFSEFKVRHAKSKDCPNRLTPKESMVSRTDSLYAELVAKEARLKDIAININKTNKNATLLNSILRMKSCNLRKFSAKVNDHGIVTIDENMVQSEVNQVEHSPIQDEIPNSSYANIFSRKNKPLNEEKIQFYPPMVNSEELAEAVKRKVNQDTPNTTIHEGSGLQDDAGFTVVRRVKNNNKKNGLGSGNNHMSNNIQGGRMRYNTDSRTNSNGRTGNAGLVNLYERNIVNNQNMEEVTGNSGVRRENGNLGSTSGNKTNPPIPRLHDQRNMGARAEASGKGINAANQKYRVVETINRFSLLDTDGNELENVIEGMEAITNQTNKPCNSNDGWIKKQERILNTKYSKDIIQEQRFEEKRYVIDQLVPLESVLSGWSSPQLQYFRHLCSIHNFGLGYVATNREADEARSDVDMGMDAENIEEVESETEGAAMMMKDDGPIETNSANQSKNDQDPCSPNQRDVDMLHAGNFLCHFSTDGTRNTNSANNGDEEKTAQEIQTVPIMAIFPIATMATLLIETEVETMTEFEASSPEERAVVFEDGDDIGDNSFIIGVDGCQRKERVEAMEFANPRRSSEGVVTDLGYGSEVVYLPRFLTYEKSWEHFLYLDKHIPWTRPTIHVFGKPCVQPRDVCYVASKGLKDLIYSGYKPDAYSWDDYPPLKEILEEVHKAFPGTHFNSLLMNRYNSGNDYVGWHADDEKLYGPNPEIASISFGCERDFFLKKKSHPPVVGLGDRPSKRPKNNDSVEKHCFKLKHGSLLLMRGNTQRDWLHSLPKRAKAESARINLTFRRVI